MDVPIERSSEQPIDIADMAEPSPEILEGFKNDFIGLMDTLVPKTEMKQAVSFNITNDTLTDDQPDISRIQMGRSSETGDSIQLFTSGQTAAICTLTFPENGDAPRLDSFDYDYAFSALQGLDFTDADTSDATSADGQLALLAQSTLGILNRIISAKQSGFDVHEDYEGPLDIVNEDGTITFTDEHADHIDSWLPHIELDGIFSSEEEISAAKTAITALLARDPEITYTSIKGGSNRALPDAGDISARINIVNGDGGAKEMFEESGICAYSLHLETETNTTTIGITQSGKVEISFHDKEEFKRAVNARLKLGEAVTSFTTDSAFSGYSVAAEGSQEFMTSVAVRLEEFESVSRKPTVGSIKKVTAVFQQIRSQVSKA